MNRISRLALALLFSVCSVSSWAAPMAPTVAVLDLLAQSGIDAAVVAPVTEALMEELVGSRAYVVLDRGYIEQVLKEKEFQLSGMVTDAQAAAAGQYLGADYVVAGKIQLLDTTYIVVAKLIDVRTGVILAQSSESGEGRVAMLLGLAHAVGLRLAFARPGAPAETAAAVTAAPAERTPIPQVEDRQPSGAVKLTVLALEQQFSGPDPAAWKAVLEAFHERYPHISVTVENVKDPGPYYKRLTSLRDSRKLPDLFMLSNERPLGLSLPARDLRPLLKGREAVYFPAALRREADGSIVSLPLTMSVGQVLYANTALLSRLGLSWPRSLDELLAQAPAIKAAGLQAISMYMNGWPLSSCLLSTLVERTGGAGWIDRAVGGNGTSFEAPSFIAALEVMRKLSAAKMLSGDLESTDYDAPLRAFTGGGSVYFLDGIWQVPALNDAMAKGSLTGLQLGAFPEITGAAGLAGSTAGQLRGWAMNAALAGDKELAAWLWLWFCAGPEGQGLLYGRGGDWGATIDPRDLGNSVEPVFAMKYDFLQNSPPLGDAFDLRMDAGYLNNELKDLVVGRKQPAQVGREMEVWAKAYLAARKKK